MKIGFDCINGCEDIEICAMQVGFGCIDGVRFDEYI